MCWHVLANLLLSSDSSAPNNIVNRLSCSLEHLYQKLHSYLHDGVLLRCGTPAVLGLLPAHIQAPDIQGCCISHFQASNTLQSEVELCVGGLPRARYSGNSLQAVA